MIDLSGIIVWIGAVVAAVLTIKTIIDYLTLKKQDERVLEAEKEAFKGVPESAIEGLEEVFKSQSSLEERTKVIESLLRESHGTVTQGRLFSLYSRQIEKYQKETQSRAGWSFVFSIFAMVAGLGFVFWGGSEILSQSGWKHVAAGSAISTIGGAISAYITKTFLDVHKVSLSQLNRYFKQPVVNELILTAQRLADDLGGGEERKNAYRSIIGSIVTLIQGDIDSRRLSASNRAGE